MASYGTTTGLTDYATATGRVVSGTPAQLLVAATDYIDGTYWHQFKGTAASDDNFFDPAPDRVTRATYEAALLLDADSAALSSGAVSNAGGGAVASEKVDVIAVSYHAPNSDAMTDNAVSDAIPKYSAIENILRPLLKRWSGADAGAFVV
jgi:hypothetical protein